MLNFTVINQESIALHFSSYWKAQQFWKEVVTQDCKSINTAGLRDCRIDINTINAEEYMRKHNIRNLC